MKKLSLVSKKEEGILYWGATFYLISRRGMEKIMNLYD